MKDNLPFYPFSNFLGNLCASETKIEVFNIKGKLILSCLQTPCGKCKSVFSLSAAGYSCAQLCS